jgi:hypothetical protein
MSSRRKKITEHENVGKVREAGIRIELWGFYKEKNRWQVPMTCGQIARNLKLRKESLYNVLAWMWNQKMVTKKKGDKGIYEYCRVKDCLLSQLFYPTPAQVEKQFKIKDRKHYHIEDGTSKGYGGQKITYGDSHYNSVYWGE